jgi:hypothetical protein
MNSVVCKPSHPVCAEILDQSTSMDDGSEATCMVVKHPCFDCRDGWKVRTRPVDVWGKLVRCTWLKTCFQESVNLLEGWY